MSIIKEKLQDQQWYKGIAYELRMFKKNKSRVGVLEQRLYKQVLPSAKVIASYGDITSRGISEDTTEQEYMRLKDSVESIELALQALKEHELKIIELKFFEGNADRRIYDGIYPMASGTYYKTLNSAMLTMKYVMKSF